MGVLVKRTPSTARLATALAATLVGGLFVTAPAPAQAAPLGSIAVETGPYVRTSAGCKDHPVKYRVTGSDPDPGTWTVQLRLYQPGAAEPFTGITYSSGGGAGAPAGTLKVRICGKDVKQGKYYLEYRLLHGPQLSRTISDATLLTVRHTATRTTLRTAKLSGKKYRARIGVRVEKPGGYVALRGAKVRMQQRTASGWKDVSGATGTTDAKGVAVFPFTSPRPRAKVEVRAVTRSAPYRSGSVSKSRTIGG